MRTGGRADQADGDVGRVDAARDPRDEPVAEGLDLLARAGRRVEERDPLDRRRGDELDDALAGLARVRGRSAITTIPSRTVMIGLTERSVPIAARAARGGRPS